MSTSWWPPHSGQIMGLQIMGLTARLAALTASIFGMCSVPFANLLCAWAIIMFFPVI
jgi:hypothetical protein